MDQLMMDYRWNRSYARRKYDEIFGNAIHSPTGLHPALQSTRTSLLQIAASNHRDWELDWRLGLALHAIADISLSSASDPEFWPRLNIELVPEILADRWGINRENMSEKAKLDRVFGRSRNYLGSVWRIARIVTGGDRTILPGGDREEVRVLSRMSTDNLVAIVERTGGGYSSELLRAILFRLFGDKSFVRNRSNMDVLRKVMIVNTAWLHSVIPEHSTGGITGYVDRLFDRVGLAHERS